MAEPTLLGNIIQPAWQALTPEQRTCWHFWALAHPQITRLNELRTLYGQQAHYSRNKSIAVTLTAPLLTNPPPNDALPSMPTIYSRAWSNAARLAGNITARGGLAYLEVLQPPAANVWVIVTQGYDKKRKGTGRPPRVRHVTTIAAGFTGTVALTDPEGYFASTNGRPKFSFITGRTAQRRRDKPLGKVRVINIDSGIETSATLANPFGGSNTETSRPIHDDGPQAAGNTIRVTYNSAQTDYLTSDTGAGITT